MAGRVAQLPVDPGPAGWNCLLPVPPPAEPLEEGTTADWLVIGAGFAGLAAARRLVQLCPGDRIVMLEAHRVANGPAGRNSGFMIDLPHDLSSGTYAGRLDADRMQTADNRHAIGFATELADEFGLSAEAFALSGKVNGAANARGERHNRIFAQHLKALGEDHEWLDAPQMRELTGTDYYRGGLFTPGSAMIQPAMFVRGVADGLRGQGVVLHENSPVISLARNGDWAAKTPGGKVTAPNVILAVNGHLQSFGHMAARLMHVFTYASMTRALTGDEVSALGGEAVWGLTPADPMGTTIRRISGVGGDRIVVRHTFTYEPGLEVSLAKLARITGAHDRAFEARFPKLSGVPMEYRWGGRLCLSRNGVQVIGQLDEGLWAACCQNGLGTAKGTLAGLLAAEAATGTRSERLDRALAADAPVRLPPAPLMRLGAAARLKVMAFLAGREV